MSERMVLYLESYAGYGVGSVRRWGLGEECPKNYI